MTETICLKQFGNVFTDLAEFPSKNFREQKERYVSGYVVWTKFRHRQRIARLSAEEVRLDAAIHHVEQSFSHFSSQDFFW